MRGRLPCLLLGPLQSWRVGPDKKEEVISSSRALQVERLPESALAHGVTAGQIEQLEGQFLSGKIFQDQAGLRVRSAGR